MIPGGLQERVEASLVTLLGTCGSLFPPGYLRALTRPGSDDSLFALVGDEERAAAAKRFVDSGCTRPRWHLGWHQASSRVGTQVARFWWPNPPRHVRQELRIVAYLASDPHLPRYVRGIARATSLRLADVMVVLARLERWDLVHGAFEAPIVQPEAPRQPGAPRRRYYVLTPAGREVARDLGLDGGRP